MIKETLPPEKVRENPGQELLDYYKDKVLIHDVAGAYPQLMTVVGIDGYAYRAFTAPARVVYVSSTYKNIIEGQLDYMRSIGIGPKDVRSVPTSKDTPLVEAAWKDLKERGELKGGIELDLFGQSEETQRVFIEHVRAEAEALGVSVNEPKAVHDIKESVGVHTSLRLAGTGDGMANNKLFIRMIMQRRRGQDPKDPDSLNVNFVPVKVGQDIRQPFWEANVKQLIEGSVAHSVIIKATNKASGEALRFCGKLEHVQEFIEQERKSDPDMQFIIEEDLRDRVADEMSAQFLVRSEEDVVFLCATKNIVKNNNRNDPASHWGNAIAGDPKHPINTALESKKIEELKEVVKYYAQLGYRGYIGLDLLLLRSGAIKVLEANARITGATYPLLILEQLARERKSRDFVVLATNAIKPDMGQLKTFSQLKEALGELMYTAERGEGIIPTFVSPLPDKFGAVVVAADLERARQVMSAAMDRVGVYRGGL